MSIGDPLEAARHLTSSHVISILTGEARLGPHLAHVSPDKARSPTHWTALGGPKNLGLYSPSSFTPNRGKSTQDTYVALICFVTCEATHAVRSRESLK